MNTAFDPRRNAANYEVPVPPEEFGQDGGKFYHYYDTFAEEIDENMVSGLKEQLEGLLIFAGLFAGVNSAFLALTLPLMSPDPADDTNALLRDNNAILLNIALGRNDTLPSPSPLPSETFSPTGKVLTVNVLFSVSLTFAIISSFLAVLGRQWFVYYRKRTGGGPERQRWEQLKRFLGAEKWQLDWVLDDFLPSLLQIGLIIFCISLTIYLSTLHSTLSNVVRALMCVGLAILIITAIFAAWDKFCPFQSPLSHAMSASLPWVIRVASWPPGFLVILIYLLIVLIVCCWSFLLGIAGALLGFCLHGPSNVKPPWEEVVQIIEREDQAEPYKDVKSGIDSIVGHLSRKREEDDETLQIIAIRRAICTSDDAWTQVHAVSNILGITNTDLLQQLATDYEFFLRISELCKSSYNRTLQLCGRNRADLAAATCWLYRAAVTHINLSIASSARDRFTSDQCENLPFLHGHPRVSSLSLSLIDATPIMVAPWLGHMADPNHYYPEGARGLELKLIIDGVVNPSWRCVSMIIAVVMMEWNVSNRNHEELHAAYTRDPSTTLQKLKLLVEESNSSSCRDRDTLQRYLFKIFKLARAAAGEGSGHSRDEVVVTAMFLRFSERFVRAENLPSDAIDVGRHLRGELISALRLKCEKPPGRETTYFETGFDEVLEELRQLFTELTKSLKTSSNEDDAEVLLLASPILQHLTVLANTLDDWGGFEYRYDNVKFKRQVTELNEAFASFKAAVAVASRAILIKRRNIDPDLRWCYYDKEWDLPARLKMQVVTSAP